jgi:hypothetical protein
VLGANGVVVSEALVAEVLDRVKQLRERMIATGQHARAVDDFYRNYDRLGIGEAALVELALESAVTARPHGS